MAAEPINIFSCKIDPRGVVQTLRALVPDLTVAGPDDAWQKITLTRKRGFWRKPLSLTLRHDPEYYEGADWPMQRLGMRNYFARFPDTPRKDDVLRLIMTFRFSLAVDGAPELSLEAQDDRLAWLYAVVQHLDGVLFTPSSLRDAQGRKLIEAGGFSDADAVLPKMPPSAPGEEDAGDAETSDAGEEPEPEPPAPQRVARRTLALAAACARALLEQRDPGDPRVEEVRGEILTWLESLEIGDELEPEEWKVLQRPVGTLPQQDIVNATWRLEGLGVLAWALHRFELPAYDQLVDPPRLLEAVGYLDEDKAKGLLSSPDLRPQHELDALATHLLALHWRLRDFSLRPQTMDFVAFSRNCWFGSFDLTPFKIIKKDLALQGRTINEVSDEVVRTCQSLAMERHLAINWLRGYAKVYSETDTAT